MLDQKMERKERCRSAKPAQRELIYYVSAYAESARDRRCLQTPPMFSSFTLIPHIIKPLFLMSHTRRQSSWRASLGPGSAGREATTPYTPNDRVGPNFYAANAYGSNLPVGQSPSSSTLAISPVAPHFLNSTLSKVNQQSSDQFNNGQPSSAGNNPPANAATYIPPGSSSVHKSINAYDTPHRAKSGSSIALNSLLQQPLSQVERLRLWRHDAIMQHHYQTAEYIGDKILALTNDPNDAFWLAQVFYLSGQYTRARQLLIRQELDRSVSCRYLAALCLTKMGKWEEALSVLGEKNPFGSISGGPGAAGSNSGSSAGALSANTAASAYKVKNQDGGIKLEASMCFLRGQIYTNQNNFEQAKECYKEAVQVDAKCFEAFDQLIRGCLLTPKEEWDLLASLDFDESCAGDTNAADLIKALYTTRLGKFENLAVYRSADELLTNEYDLGDNPDVLLSRADLLFVQCKFKKCLEVCELILDKDKFRFSAIPNYLACLHELGKRNKLFLMSHELVDNHPDEAVSWLAVGVYYLTIGKILEARRYFSKSSMMSPFFGQAWIGFAHTFAVEGEHEQAISAYTTAARLFQGTHLPSLFLGMQHLQLNNLTLAEEYLQVASSICETDPLLLNERGVVHYHKNELVVAESYFIKAQEAAEKLESDPRGWLSIKANLGHVYRRMGDYYRALGYFEEVLRITPQDANIYSAMGLANLQAGHVVQAVENFHSALAIMPNDPVATDLLKRALEDSSSMAVWDTFTEDLLEDLNEEIHEDVVYSAPPPEEWVDTANVGKGAARGKEKRRVSASLTPAVDSRDDLADILGKSAKTYRRQQPPPTPSSKQKSFGFDAKVFAKDVGDAGEGTSSMRARVASAHSYREEDMEQEESMDMSD